ncbi:hypothetical protein [Pseudomonas syringae]|uniref:Uncharacterized protein n=1 Tax=Pseudomonas syringae TaxID=317 RepID=A0A085VHF3_PSESX|nr:hypothetical protein [Pseudomonas syringae]KFE54866.1 hypothetical protein IV01_14275 [Pseudomonas syringae]
MRLPTVILAHYPYSSVITSTLDIFVKAPACAGFLQEPRKQPMVLYQAAAKQMIHRRTETDLNVYQA